MFQTFLAPPSASDYFTLVEISMFSGRTLEAKRKLYRLIVHKLGALGIPPEDVRIVLYEPPMENWGIRAGVPASEVDLGFEVKV
ncbi:MAG: tautomerase family protein [Pseudomonadota bacterium]